MRRQDNRVSNALTDEIKKRFFYIDYLRMHRYGKRIGLFRKNRGMLDPSIANDAKKGFKAYIQRIFRDILLHEAKEIINQPQDVIKPRNFFGYEIGRKEDGGRDKLDLSTKEDRIKQIIRIYCLTGYDPDELIQEYANIVNECTMIKTKNRYGGLVVRLDSQRSDGWKALSELRKIIDVQKKMLEKFRRTPDFLKVMLHYGLKSTRRVTVGMKVKYRNIIYTVMQVTMDRYNNNEKILNLVDEHGSELSNIRYFEVEVMDSAIPGEFEENIKLLESIERIHSYIEEFFDNESGNLDSQALFTLAKSALIRQARLDRDTDLREKLATITYEMYSDRY